MIARWRKWSQRRRTVAVVTFMVPVLAVGYVAYSIVAWHSLQDRVTIAAADVQTAVSELQAQDLTPDRLQRALDAMTRAGDISCQPSAITAWQHHIVPRYKELLMQCSDVSHTVSIEAAGKLRDYSVFDQQAAGVMRRLSDSLRNAAAHDFDAMIAAWERAQQDMSRVAWGHNDDVRQLRDTLAQHALSVVQELRALKNAHDAKNRQQYDEAVRRVHEAHQRFTQTKQAASQIMTQRARQLFQ